MSSNESLPQSETMTAANESLKHRHLAALATALAVQQYPGYPAFDDRLFALALDHSHDCRPDIGFGRSDTGAVWPSPGEYAAIQDSGLATDQLGRPIHPWLEEMVTDPQIGVVTGREFYRHWGPNYTADSVVIKAGHILLVERTDLGVLALPGGFVDPEDDLAREDDPARTAGLRELKEETTLDVSDHHEAPIVYKGLVVDLRMTAHAWPETTALLINLGNHGSLPAVRGKDDAKWAGWVPLEEARQSRLFGSHNLIIELALASQ
ncbi:MAG TPA: NUDIX domain-containing protein [Verrucomicrobiae bacterium]|jgi:ADP-ribose pyrophosphatase YjhB (NUDIX family)|nr:NUDIX domain-containing protein [Verrucomicrobiae bacterium]